MHNPARHAVHNHFLLKAVDLVKPGGVVAVLTSTWTLDAATRRPGGTCSRPADLLGAVRLPSAAHRAAAGTDVVTDLLVLCRRLPGEAPMPFGWERTVEVDTDDGPTRINAWFADQPHTVLGRLGLGGAYATALTVTSPMSPTRSAGPGRPTRQRHPAPAYPSRPRARPRSAA